MAEREGDERRAGERLDQEWTELLEELRVVLPGTEVLFAFLLILPFTQRFDDVAGTDKTVYTVAFLAAAAATLLLMAPSAHHRLLWRTHRKAPELKLATGFAIAGTFCLALDFAHDQVDESTQQGGHRRPPEPSATVTVVGGAGSATTRRGASRRQPGHEPTQ